jgi:hypothetical protein
MHSSTLLRRGRGGGAGSVSALKIVECKGFTLCVRRRPGAPRDPTCAITDFDGGMGRRVDRAIAISQHQAIALNTTTLPHHSVAVLKTGASAQLEPDGRHGASDDESAHDEAPAQTASLKHNHPTPSFRNRPETTRQSVKATRSSPRSGRLDRSESAAARRLPSHEETYLDEISRYVVTGAHAVVLLDQASWHITDKLKEPANITLLPLPPKSPELNPQGTSGSICARTSSPTACSRATRPFSTPASTLGAASLPRPDASPPLALATGP